MCKGSLIVLRLGSGTCIPVAMRRGYRHGSDWTRTGEAAKEQIEKRLAKAGAKTVADAVECLGVPHSLGVLVLGTTDFRVAVIHFENGKPQ